MLLIFHACYYVCYFYFYAFMLRCSFFTRCLFFEFEFAACRALYHTPRVDTPCRDIETPRATASAVVSYRLRLFYFDADAD